MPSPFVLCDVFADRPFAGNPLAVVLEGRDISDETMASLAREFGWSEITFVVPQDDDRPPRVRIWTPQGELPFAGHPTVGTAVVLAASGYADIGWNVLELGIGPVAVDVMEAGPSGGRATMTQRSPQFGKIFEDRSRLAEGLGLAKEDLLPELPAQAVSTGLTHFMVPVRSLAALGRAAPVAPLFASLVADMGTRWAYLFSVETADSAAAARARLVGVGMEDAATGSAAGPLGAYLVRYGLHRAGALDVEQGIEMGRPSRIQVDVPLEDGEVGPVRVTGSVHIWGRGTLGDNQESSPML